MAIAETIHDLSTWHPAPFSLLSVLLFLSLQRSIKGKKGLGCFIIEGVVNFIEKMCLLPSLLLI